jgi:Molybdopterin oxidoreductase Fe4S4 domain
MASTATPEWQKTACIICALNCGLEVHTEGRRIVRTRGDKSHPISQGYICEKSQRVDYYQNGADRLLSPMRRRAFLSSSFRPPLRAPASERRRSFIPMSKKSLSNLPHVPDKNVTARFDVSCGP